MKGRERKAEVQLNHITGPTQTQGKHAKLTQNFILKLEVFSTSAAAFPRLLSPNPSASSFCVTVTVRKECVFTSPLFCDAGE